MRAKEAEWTLRAEFWDQMGRSPEHLYVVEESIDWAAQILDENRRSWSFRTKGSIEPSKVRLRDYCLSVFALSRTPDRLVQGARRGKRHVHVAAMYGLVELLSVFDDLEPGCLESAAERAHDHAEIRRLLIEDARFDVATPLMDGNTPLMFAAAAEDRSIVEHMLLRPNVNLAYIRSDGKSAALLLVKAKMGDIVRKLVEAGRIDPWASSSPMLLSAATADEDDLLVDAILAKKEFAPAVAWQKSVNEGFLLAVERYQLGTVRRYLGLGANPDAVDSRGQSVLAKAAILGRVELIDMVLPELDGSLEQCDEWGRSAVDHAPQALRDKLREKPIPAGGRGRWWQQVHSECEHFD